MQIRHKLNSGFTLIELLLVIGVLGILVAATTLSFPGAQKRARDSERVSDIKQYSNALEIYYTANNGVYPPASGTMDEVCTNNAFNVEECPKDPKEQSYEYVSIGSGADYFIYSKMEASETGYYISCSTGVSGTVVSDPSGASVCPLLSDLPTPTPTPLICVADDTCAPTAPDICCDPYRTPDPTCSTGERCSCIAAMGYSVCSGICMNTENNNNYCGSSCDDCTTSGKVCSSGVCVDPNTVCGTPPVDCTASGYVCNLTNACVPEDQCCGPSCSNCTASGKVCNSGSGTCELLLSTTPCAAPAWITKKTTCERNGYAKATAKWTSVPGALTYRFETANLTTSSWDTPTSSDVVSGITHSRSNLADGDYRYRVRVESSDPTVCVAPSSWTWSAGPTFWSGGTPGSVYTGDVARCSWIPRWPICEKRPFEDKGVVVWSPPRNTSGLTTYPLRIRGGTTIDVNDDASPYYFNISMSSSYNGWIHSLYGSTWSDAIGFNCTEPWKHLGTYTKTCDVDEDNISPITADDVVVKFIDGGGGDCRISSDLGPNAGAGVRKSGGSWHYTTVNSQGYPWDCGRWRSTGGFGPTTINRLWIKAGCNGPEWGKFDVWYR